MKKVFIIDGHSIIFKVYYSFINRPLITKEGENVSILHGFLTKLYSIIDKFNPDYLAIAFDTKEKTFREEIYKEYKANRDKAPDEVNRQTPILLEILKELGFKIIFSPGFEADDIIYKTSIEIKKHNDKSLYIYTVDKDLLQLVNDKIFVVSSKSKSVQTIIYNKEKVFEDWGIYPEQIQDYLALIGDSVDNIPGVKGIGPKTAIKLLTKYKTLDNIYNYLNTVTPESLKKRLKEGKEDAYLSKKLIQLSKDVPIKIDFCEWVIPESYSEKGVSLLKKYELKSIYEKLTKKQFKEQIGLKTITNTNYNLVSDEDTLKKYYNEFKKSIILSFDTETTGFDPIGADILGASFSWNDGHAIYIPLNNDEKRKKLLPLIGKILQSNDFQIIGQNIKYDYKVLSKYGIKIKNILFDTMVGARFLVEESEKVGMDYLAEKFLRYKTIHYKDIVTKKETTLNDYPIDKVKDYACEDADITLKLFNKIYPLIKENNFLNIYEKIENPVIKILAEMELQGIKVDTEYFNDLNKKIGLKINELENSIYNLAEEKFLINSTKQLQKILFEKLKLPVIKKGKTGPSTDEYVLKELIPLHPIIEKLLDYRKYVKLKNTYIEPILNLTKKDQKIHTTYNQAFVATGRLSSTNPNLQNIPVFEKGEFNIRKGFIAEKGFKLVSADYSQIELRVLAYFSKDEELKKAFLNKEDIHKYTASMIFGKSVDKISSFERKIAKTINFGVIYGLSPFGLSKQLNISRGDATTFIAMYFSRFKGIKEYTLKLADEVKKSGYTKTLFGRKRYIPQLRSSNKNDQKLGLRLALNTQIQGTAAEIMKLAMIEVYNYIFNKYLIKNKDKKNNKNNYKNHNNIKNNYKNNNEKDYNNITNKNNFQKVNNFDYYYKIPDLKEGYSLQKDSPLRMLLQIHDELVFEIKEDIVNEETENIKLMMQNIMKDQKEWDIPLIVNTGIGNNWDELKG